MKTKLERLLRDGTCCGWAEIPRDAAWLLVGNDEISCRDYYADDVLETSFYFAHGVHIKTVCNFISGDVQYYIQDINA
tara:strand:- start:565 stop:798 length:234 start_codon:yes stop_codon:yes gene_type:complete